MKKKLLTLALVLGAASVALAGPKLDHLPETKRGEAVADAMYGGYSQSRVAQTGEHLVCTGKCLLAGFSVNTGPLASWYRVRATGTANGAGTIALLRSFVQVHTAQATANPIVLPMYLSTGFSVQLSAVSGGEEVTVFYLDLD